MMNDDDRDVIMHGETGLRVNVFSLENEGFTSTQGELHIFGEDHGGWLAFETDNYHFEALDIFKGALVWYARYLDCPEMEIQTEDPRPAVQLKRYKRSGDGSGFLSFAE
jgi:hypothetical protein